MAKEEVRECQGRISERVATKNLVSWEPMGRKVSIKRKCSKPSCCKVVINEKGI